MVPPTLGPVVGIHRSAAYTSLRPPRGEVTHSLVLQSIGLRIDRPSPEIPQPDPAGLDPDQSAHHTATGCLDVRPRNIPTIG